MKISFSKAMTVVSVAIVATFTSCTNSPYPGYELDEETGVYAQFYTQAENGVKPVEGDMLRISLVVKTPTDSILTDSKDPKYNRSGLTYYEFPLMKPEFNGSFEAALAMMSVGDSASFLVSVDSMYKSREMPPFLTKGTMITYDVVLQKITAKSEVEAQQKKQMEEQQVMMAKMQAEEATTLAKYLADNKITAKPTESGLYYIETKKGNGKKPNPGDVVKVNYTGRTLDGKIFDTSFEAIAKEAGVFDERRKPYDPIEFPLAQRQVIQGWEEGLLLMSPGAKGQLIIPSALGYGAQGGGPIPPFSPLIFDLELISVTAAPKGQGQVIEGQKVN